MSDAKCIIILSEKSSGSSALQNLLAKYADINLVSKTRHFQNETLYWTKAASILGFPQLNMLDSEVPIEREKAKQDLITLLVENTENYIPPRKDRELIFGGWRLLCETNAPIFLEKSPHHLYQWAAIELILECIYELTDIEFLLIGLVRNPMDTIYSQFKRWRTRPEYLQHQWLVAYQNLIKFRDRNGNKLIIIRYEDIVSSLSYLRPVFDFCNVEAISADQNYLHQKSISKWKKDRNFGFVLSEEVITLAQTYGYQLADLTNKKTPFWPVYRECKRAVYRSKMMLKSLCNSF